MGVSRGLSPGISTGSLSVHLTEFDVARKVGTIMDVENVYDLYDDLKSGKPGMTEVVIDQA